MLKDLWALCCCSKWDPEAWSELLQLDVGPGAVCWSQYHSPAAMTGLPVRCSMLLLTKLVNESRRNKWWWEGLKYICLGKEDAHQACHPASSRSPWGINSSSESYSGLLILQSKNRPCLLTLSQLALCYNFWITRCRNVLLSWKCSASESIYASTSDDWNGIWLDMLPQITQTYVSQHVIVPHRSPWAKTHQYISVKWKTFIKPQNWLQLWKKNLALKYKGALQEILWFHRVLAMWQLINGLSLLKGFYCSQSSVT